MSEVYRTRKGHSRRVILVHPGAASRASSSGPMFYAYCIGCAWYQGGTYSEIAVEWIDHTGGDSTP